MLPPEEEDVPARPRQPEYIPKPALSQPQLRRGCLPMCLVLSTSPLRSQVSLSMLLASQPACNVIDSLRRHVALVVVLGW
jgi:hypothetical protein